MSYRTGMTALAIAALTLAPSVAGAQTTAAATSAQKVDDSTLDNRIEARLKADATLKNDTIDVSVDNGVVTLSGKVYSTKQRARAAQLAKITGVTRVENKLEVETAATTGVGDKTDKAMDKAADKTDKAMDKAGDKADKAKDKADAKSEKAADKSKDIVSETSEAITDTWITSYLAAKFVDEPTLKGSNINVDTDDHVVTLKGTVMSAAGRARAVAIAKDTKGVSRVIDTLTIGPKK